MQSSKLLVKNMIFLKIVYPLGQGQYFAILCGRVLWTVPCVNVDLLLNTASPVFLYLLLNVILFLTKARGCSYIILILPTFKCYYKDLEFSSYAFEIYSNDLVSRILFL